MATPDQLPQQKGTNAIATQAKPEYWKNFKAKCSTTIASPKDLSNFTSNLPTISQSVDAVELVKGVKRTIEKVITIHLGVRPGLLSDDLLEAVIAEVIQKFPGFTLRDIEWAYDRHNFEKRDDWRMVTKSEIMQPIQAWAWKKTGIGEEFEKFKTEEAEEAKAAEKLEAFKDECRILYNEAVDSLEWSGSIFQASAIAREVAKQIKPAIKSKLWKEANETSERIEEENTRDKRLGASLQMDKIGRTPERVFSELIVKEGIKNGVKLDTNKTK